MITCYNDVDGVIIMIARAV